jgi:pimeloyl-[acyl-carrier protein] methyl ester esterase
MTILFCHGFGFDPTYWANLSSCFSHTTPHFIDLGYFGHSFKPKTLKEPLIGVGHSLGFLKLLEMDLPFTHLIGLNAFTDFLGEDPFLKDKREKELSLLKRNLLKSPHTTLKNFYTRCGLKLGDFKNPQILSLNALVKDLDFLKTAVFEKDFPCPTLIINTLDDVIVPKEITLENFSNKCTLTFLNDGSHALGYKRTQEIDRHINTFCQ